MQRQEDDCRELAAELDTPAILIENPQIQDRSGAIALDLGEKI